MEIKDAPLLIENLEKYMKIFNDTSLHRRLTNFENVHSFQLGLPRGCKSNVPISPPKRSSTYSKIFLEVK